MTVDGINRNAPADRVTVLTTPDIVSGPTTELTRWGFTVDGSGPVLPTTIQISGGNIRLINTLFGSTHTVTHCQYTPGTSRFTAATGETLEAFSLPVPFP